MDRHTSRVAPLSSSGLSPTHLRGGSPAVSSPTGHQRANLAFGRGTTLRRTSTPTSKYIFDSKDAFSQATQLCGGLTAIVACFNPGLNDFEPLSLEALKNLPVGKVWLTVTICDKQPASSSQEDEPSVEKWLTALQDKFKADQLPTRYLVHAVPHSGTDNVKVDRSPHCLYTSLLAYTSSRKDSACQDSAEHWLSKRGMCHRSFGHHDDADRSKPRMHSKVCAKYDPKWHRISMCLAEHVLVTFFEDRFVHADFKDKEYGPLMPNAADYGEGLDFVLYKVAEATVRLTSIVIKKYEVAINETEGVVLNHSQRPTYAQDVDHTTSLHLMRNELAMMKHIIAPTQRVLTTILNEYGADKASPLMGATAVDYLEEVGDELIAVREDIDIAMSTCEQVSGLIFNLSSYNDTRNGQVTTIAATVFLPLTWLCGIYGMNFDYIPELHWRGGYWYFWALSFIVALVTTYMATVPMGYLERLGYTPLSLKSFSLKGITSCASGRCVAGRGGTYEPPAGEESEAADVGAGHAVVAGRRGSGHGGSQQGKKDDSV